MSLRTALIGATLVAVPLAGFIGLRPALADNTPACGAVTKGPTCEQSNVFNGALYQVSRTFPDADGKGGPLLCDGGPSLDSRDTALGDNLLQYFVAVSGSGLHVSQVTDSKGRLVGYSMEGDVSGFSSSAITFFLTCVDDHTPFR